jgi:hypothetical protein
MAHALRKEWVSPEEQHESRAAAPRPRRVSRPALGVWQRPLPLTGLILGVVCAVMLFIRCNDCIAQRDLKAQSLRQELAQLDRECVQLNLELNRMGAEPQLSHMAQTHALALPAPTQIHYAKVTTPLPQTAVAVVAPRASLAARSGHVVVASFHGFWQRLMPTPAAYAQD